MNEVSLLGIDFWPRKHFPNVIVDSLMSFKNIIVARQSLIGFDINFITLLIIRLNALSHHAFMKTNFSLSIYFFICVLTAK